MTEPAFTALPDVVDPADAAADLLRAVLCLLAELPLLACAWDFFLDCLFLLVLTSVAARFAEPVPSAFDAAALRSLSVAAADADP
ncbi:MAG: hypothetical protein ABI920_17850 [Casimicrobiaceae bacterium]